MKLFYNIPILIITLLFLFSCGNEPKKKDVTSPSSPIQNNAQAINSFAPGKIFKNIKCLNHPELSYTIYLPKEYSDSIKSPVVFLFDAQGRGDLPVKKYQDIADEFNLIIACSNDSKNGLSGEAVNMISYSFIKDVLTRFNINKNQIYAGGFSGGARVAVQVADMDKQIKGVFGVGAGLPNADYINKIDFNYFIAAGNKDFNYMELFELSKTLKKNGINYYFMEFDGKHEWPQSNIFRTALFYMILNNSEEIYSKDDFIVKQYISFEKDNLQAAFNTNDLVEQVRIYERMSLILNKITNTIKYQKKLKILYTTTIYSHHIKNLKKALEYEKSAQKPLSQAISTQNTEWWNKTITQLEQNTTNSASSEENLANQRLLNYLSLLSYMYADNSLKNNKLAEAQKYLYIYEKVDPENTEVYYLKAIYYALQNNNSLALNALEMAVSKGFNDFERIAKDPHFHFSEIEIEVISASKKTLQN